MQKGDSSSIELLLKNILDIVNKLESTVSLNDEKTHSEIVELKKDIRRLEELFDHEEILRMLSQNVSPEGFKDLIFDIHSNTDFRKRCDNILTKLEDAVDLNTKFRTDSIRSGEVMGQVWGYVWKIGVPVVLFVMGVVWWIIHTYFFIKPAADAVIK